MRVREEQRVIVTFLGSHECPPPEKEQERQAVGFTMTSTTEVANDD